MIDVYISVLPLMQLFNFLLVSKLDLFFHLFGFYKEHWRAWHLGLSFFSVQPSQSSITSLFLQTMKKRDGKNSCEQLVCSPGVGLVFKYPFLMEACILWKQNKKIIQSSLYLLPSHIMWHRFADLKEAWKSKTNKKSCSRVFLCLVSSQLNQAKSSAGPLYADHVKLILETLFSSPNSLTQHLTQWPGKKKKKQRSGASGDLWFWGNDSYDWCKDPLPIPSSQKSPSS